MSSTDLLSLRSVTMLEAVHALRAQRVWIQFEREPLVEATVDRSRPVLDSNRRFDVSLDLAGDRTAMMAALVAADPTYDWVPLTDRPPTYFVVPRAPGLAGSALAAAGAEVLAPAGRPLDQILAELDIGPGRRIEVFDRAGYLRRATTGTAVASGGRPLYAVVGALFAGATAELVWDVTTGVGVGPAVMAVSSLPPAR